MPILQREGGFEEDVL